ncbi:sugar transferase [Enterococcus faecium]|uniref:sugar transferase n=1 Tax=Enterococcus TaxID=1350 RepID=UPI000CF07948|nr:sugar transferase [Enterococcus faecium]EGP4765334.1 sugar transferase [Enterococcus faecium]EGP4874480.1 sugar transferase [Enterococcus faecium]EGP5401476.1 sugar transferase [Enterococcus faecium]EGP5632630.1 sugar transferase [Enterococcus faecium]EME3554964.1 sugar transferase [Enterococcus faecium]
MKDIYDLDSSNEKFEIHEQTHLNTSNFLLGGVKRFIDISVSILGLILLFVPFIFVALLIKIDDPKGPIFFCQTRIGLLGKPFILYKFRTMSVGAEDQLSELIEENEIQGPMFKMKHDPRVTRIGSVLRKLSIDEFPQLLNVLKGDMSIVGPRPALPQEVEQYSDYHRLRLLVKPGCTGLWQVSGRNNLHFEEMIELDLTYIDKGSFLLDIEIMIKTVLVIITQDGAY